MIVILEIIVLSPSDLFVAGKYVMNNYYTIFDIDNSQLKIYPDGNGYFSFEQISIIIFLFSLCIGGLIFVCCYIIYHKFCKRNRNDELNENLVQENPQEEGNANEEEMNQQQDINENIENNQNNNDANNHDNEENLDNEKIVLREDNIYDNSNNAYNGIEDNYNEYTNNNINNSNYNGTDDFINDVRNSSDNL